MSVPFPSHLPGFVLTLVPVCDACEAGTNGTLHEIRWFDYGHYETLRTDHNRDEKEHWDCNDCYTRQRDRIPPADLSAVIEDEISLETL